jgi:hypothetical protein
MMSPIYICQVCGALGFPASLEVVEMDGVYTHVLSDGTRHPVRREFRPAGHGFPRSQPPPGRAP